MLIITAGVPRLDGHTLKKANYFREAILYKLREYVPRETKYTTFMRLEACSWLLRSGINTSFLEGRVNMERKP